ncbi:carbohydrate sulfotransferase 14-like isoform X2 [Orbicella faveolata]|uniref:carbohydrate sulfotransferase 14-like isoform X2 n=1 Tax=Orbicella faveolata TaxID=48498 RepID=UPI0009E5F2A1|nr:carbohydrate sulfotransferase 14-like isoform X2 [Orbicella faveolata]
MKCSKVRFVAVVLIFSIVAGVYLLLSHSEGDDRTGSHLTRLFSSKWRSSEAKPQEETWISEIGGLNFSNSVVSSEQRLKSLRQVCGNTRQSWDSLSVTEKEILAKHILVNDEHKFLYCSVPKVACSNWKRVMMVLDGEATDTNTIRKVNHMSFTFLGDLPPLVVKRKLQEYYKFMFVRDPLVRILSAYKDKFLLNNTSFHKSHGRKIVKHVRKNVTENSKGDDVSLEEFLQYVAESRVEDMNEHWMPFYELCQPCAVSYDFVGSFENLELDANQVLKKLNVNEQVSFPKQQKYYKSGGKGHVESEKFTDVSSDMLKKALRKYDLDYKLFSYQIPNV